MASTSRRCPSTYRGSAVRSRSLRPMLGATGIVKTLAMKTQIFVRRTVVFFALRKFALHSITPGSRFFSFYLSGSHQLLLDRDPLRWINPQENVLKRIANTLRFWHKVEFGGVDTPHLLRAQVFH